MSRLDELIQEYCPDGVEYKRLIDVSNVLYGYPCDASQFNTEQEGMPLIRIRDVLEGKTQTYTTEVIAENYQVNHGDLLIGMDGNFHVANWKMSNGILCQRVCKVFSKNESSIILNRYLSHVLGPIIKNIEISKQSGTVKHLLAKDINSIILPVPPLPVQEEIVRILDGFTALTAELQDKLQAELQARKKQYEYYLGRVMETIDAKEVELGEVCSFIRGPFGGSLKKECFQQSGYAVYEQQHAIYSSLNIRYFINQQKFNELRRFEVKSGDLIVSCSRTIGKVFIIPPEAPLGIINQALLKLSPNEKIEAKYLKYHFEKSITVQLNDTARGGAIKNVPSVAELKKLKIKVPSIDEQVRIVSILDRFDSLCNDITSGLPAEIEARQKQYEYYRDKLLTFKPLS